MKQLPIFSLLLLLFLCFNLSLAQTADETLRSHGIVKQHKFPLFNGNNLNGWYTYLNKQGKNSDPDGVFKVEKNQIHISGTEYGCITTDKEYENYELEMEFKWGENTHEPRVKAARDNGLLIHSRGKDGAFSGNWMYSIECQIIEGGTGDFLVVADGRRKFSITCPVAEEKQNGTYIYKPGEKTATIRQGRINWFGRDPEWKDVKDFRGEKDVEKPVGQWNTIRVIAFKDDIYFYLNDVLVNRAMKVRPTSGRIQIQSEGAEMFVRKVEMTPLTKK